MSQSKTTLVNVNDCLRALGHTDYDMHSAERIMGLVRKYSIRIVGEFPFARGVMRMMERSQMDQLVEQFKKDEPSSAEESGNLHLGALEAKVERMNATLEANNQAIGVLIKQNNYLTDRLTQVLSQLGVPATPAP